jgi:hypothetical protein
MVIDRMPPELLTNGETDDGCDEMWEAVNELDDKIMAIQPKTAAGLAVQARMISWRERESWCEDSGACRWGVENEQRTFPGSETYCPGVVEKRDRKGSDGDLSADLELGSCIGAGFAKYRTKGIKGNGNLMVKGGASEFRQLFRPVGNGESSNERSR